MRSDRAGPVGDFFTWQRQNSRLGDRGKPQAMQKLRIPQGDPQKLRMRAEELKLKACRLANEADELLARAEEIEAAHKKNSA